MRNLLCLLFGHRRTVDDLGGVIYEVCRRCNWVGRRKEYIMSRSVQSTIPPAHPEVSLSLDGVELRSSGPRTRDEVLTYLQMFFLLTGREATRVFLPLATYHEWMTLGKHEIGCFEQKREEPTGPSDKPVGEMCNLTLFIADTFKFE